MYAGLDYGTSNSAIGVYQNQIPTLLPLYHDDVFIPSTLYTYGRSLVSEYLYHHLTGEHQSDYKKEHSPQLHRAQAERRELGLGSDEASCFFGKEAISNYVNHPEEGLFIKSPKSFLGSTGLSTTQISFFEDLVSAMMLNIKKKAEAQLQQSIHQVVIGRPVNFQGVDSEKSNQQALAILTQSAKRCGYEHIEFLYEPLAAGIDFETHLQTDKLVLVVDIGGGTSDCSMVKMGPSYVKKSDRSNDFLAHTGQRIGGNDLDIHLAYRAFMPLFGLGSLQKRGIEQPHSPFWTAVSVNNVGDQSLFTSQAFVRTLNELRQDAQRPDLLERFIQLQASKQNHRLVRSSEQTKIELSTRSNIEVDLHYIEADLNHSVLLEQYETAIQRPLTLIQNLIRESIKQAGSQPDLIYITGGSAKSPTVRNAIQKVAPGIEILDGDYYGSVASGLTKWANKLWA
ncbi:molecular chaperone [Pleionea sp. CnH1-48]|uniref:molecular chaperone n=1 Tax=Pleionea sp. CnH1-48 TaxID=2954494 RepID=UPI0020978CB2|nr:molecular chaperone [Pleionea sp. CnH1-48]MCO7224492.1 molecular chaperone [Pleionea sp. CnH1-48]